MLTLNASLFPSAARKPHSFRLIPPLVPRRVVWSVNQHLKRCLSSVQHLLGTCRWYSEGSGGNSRRGSLWAPQCFQRWELFIVAHPQQVNPRQARRRAIFSAPDGSLLAKWILLLSPVCLQAHVPGVLQSADGRAGKGHPEDSGMQSQWQRRGEPRGVARRCNSVLSLFVQRACGQVCRVKHEAGHALLPGSEWEAVDVEPGGPRFPYPGQPCQGLLTLRHNGSPRTAYKQKCHFINISSCSICIKPACFCSITGVWLQAGAQRVPQGEQTSARELTSTCSCPPLCVNLLLCCRWQYGRLFLESFLKLGMPLLDNSFKRHKVAYTWTWKSCFVLHFIVCELRITDMSLNQMLLLLQRTHASVCTVRFSASRHSHTGQNINTAKHGKNILRSSVSERTISAVLSL